MTSKTDSLRDNSTNSKNHTILKCIMYILYYLTTLSYHFYTIHFSDTSMLSIRSGGVLIMIFKGDTCLIF